MSIIYVRKQKASYKQCRYLLTFFFNFNSQTNHPRLCQWQTDEEEMFHHHATKEVSRNLA